MKLRAIVLGLALAVGAASVPGSAFASKGYTPYVTGLSQSASMSTNQVTVTTVVRADRNLTDMGIVENLYGGLTCVSGPVTVQVTTASGTQTKSATVECSGGTNGVTPAASILLVAKISQGSVVTFTNTLSWTAAASMETYSNGDYRNSGGNSSVVFKQSFSSSAI